MSSPSIVHTVSPPYSPTNGYPLIDDQSIASQSSASKPPPASRYSVAQHSLRMTKYGFAIDPVELRYPEIMNQASMSARRASLTSFDPKLVAHKLLSLIRGFWSQAAFPRGRLVKPSEQYSIVETIAGFKKNPLYPHKSTFGAITKDEHIKIKSKSTSRRAANILKNLVMKRPDKPGSEPKTLPKLSKGTYLDWIPKDKRSLAELITGLCAQMETLFSKEARIIKIKSPCVVLGDIHGNLTDLRTYERSLWPRAPVCVTENYLFLGDYVDRGNYSIECLLYLFSMKLISPERFFMLRGNHEVATIQKQYTFEKECEDKFGEVGTQLWKTFNKVFDLMPIAATIDDQIFCAHGGIPRSIDSIEALSSDIPSPLDNPEIQSPAAWEILWNDPITDSELIGMIEMDNVGATSAHLKLGASTNSPQATYRTQQIPTSPPPISSRPGSSFSIPPASAALSESGRALEGAKTVASTPAQAEAATSARQLTDVTSNITETMSESDRVLARENNPLSFYIRPDISKDNQSEQTTSDDESTLRTIPSDTSSIASTSPQQIFNDGFVPNLKRGTAYLFSDQAVKHFLEVNKLSHIIRAHEVIPTGFAFHGEGRVITIFSSSQYCGLNNQVACALVERHKIRILRMDTGDAGE